MVYLDYNATTPVDAEVLEEMLPFLEDGFGNPSSMHGAGRRVRAGIDRARERLADLLGVRPHEIIFTSGGTESCNLGEQGLWLHVDAAYAGVCAMVPGWEWIFEGVDRADSVVLNPHKWLFTPFDLSAFYTRHLDTLKAAFSLVPEYLRTSDAGEVLNLMDTGVQLGRRFRALKLWMILRYFGAEGLRARLAEHVRLARLFAGWVDDSEGWLRVAPVPFSVVCFRAVPAGVDGPEAQDAFNQRLLDEVNSTGEVFLSHTKLDGRFVLRLAVGNIRTRERHVARAWALLRHHAARLLQDASKDPSPISGERQKHV